MATSHRLRHHAGAYANLPVDKVIAVARAGFATTARAAAEKARIQTLTLEEATSANWHGETDAGNRQ